MTIFNEKQKVAKSYAIPAHGGNIKKYEEYKRL
jgi:hypothetical protein